MVTDADAPVSLRLEGEIDLARLQALAAQGRVDTLTLYSAELLDSSLAAGLAEAQEIGHLRLLCPVTRSALRRVIGLPGLHTLELSALRAPGRLGGFDKISNLLSVIAPHCLRESDLRAIAGSPRVHTLDAHASKLTARALDAVLDMPQLECLLLGGGALTDALAPQLPRGRRIRALNLAYTPLSRRGLAQVLRMPALRELDLWSTPLQLDDLDLLADLPQLESLSLGHWDDERKFDGAALFAKLSPPPGLRKVSLDGVLLDPPTRTAFKARFADFWAA